MALTPGDRPHGREERRELGVLLIRDDHIMGGLLAARYTHFGGPTVNKEEASLWRRVVGTI